MTKSKTKAKVKSLKPAGKKKIVKATAKKKPAVKAKTVATPKKMKPAVQPAKSAAKPAHKPEAKPHAPQPHKPAAHAPKPQAPAHPAKPQAPQAHNATDHCCRELRWTTVRAVSGRPRRSSERHNRKLSPFDVWRSAERTLSSVTALSLRFFLR